MNEGIQFWTFLWDQCSRIPHTQDLPSPKDPQGSDRYQFLPGLTVRVHLCDLAGVLFWQPVQIDGDANQQSAASKGGSYKRNRAPESGSYLQPTQNTIISFMNLFTGPAMMSFPTSSHRTRCNETCQPMVNDWLTYLKAKEGNRCHCGQYNGSSCREALHDVVCVLHHNGCVQTAHTGQD